MFLNETPVPISKFLGGKYFYFPLLLIFFISQLAYSQQTESPKTQAVVALQVGRPIEHELSGGEKQTYRIDLPANQYSKITVEQNGIDVLARLQSADGKTITDNDADPRLHGRETIEWTSKDSASFLLTILARQENAAPGRYKISIDEMRTATDKDYDLDEARKLNFEALSLWRADKYDEALPFAQRAVAIREKILGADHPDFATSLFTLANIDNDRGDYALAESLYRRTLAIKEKAFGKGDVSLSAIFNNMGNLYRLKGDYVAAEDSYQRALEIREKTLEPNHLLIASVLNNLGNISRVKGDDVKAAEYYRRTLAVREKALPPDHPDIATSLSNLANLYTDIATAEPLYAQALAIREKISGGNSPSVAETLYNMAVLYNDAGEYVKALPLCKRALTIDENSLGTEHPFTAYALELLATIYRDTGDYAQAEPLYQRSITIKEKTQGVNHPDLGSTYGNSAALYALEGMPEKAIALQSSANSNLEFNIALNLTIGSEKEKFDYLKRLDEYVDQTLQINFQYAPDSEAAAKLGAEMILRRKGRVLDAMADNISTLRRRFNEQDRLVLESLDKINKQISETILNGIENETAAEYQAKIKALTDTRDELEDNISRRAAGFYEKSQPINSSKIQPLIQPDSALVEFTIYNAGSPKGSTGNAKLRTNPHYAVYVLHNQGQIRGKDLGDAVQINAVIDAFRKALRDPNRKDVQLLARAVDEKVMQPVRSLLGNSKNLLISPDGELNLIPFEAMADEQGHYLIENYSFTYLTSGRDLLRMQIPHQSQSSPLLIADPAFGSPAPEAAKSASVKSLTRQNKAAGNTVSRDLPELYFSPLSGTAQEARAIKSVFPESNMLTGTQATKMALEQIAAPQILHIATHGFFLRDAENNSLREVPASMRGLKSTTKLDNPLLRSGLALAGANRRLASSDDGILTALEASGLNLWGTKLVVLSACDTGLGEIRNGEGVYGLRRAFVLAGAESLIMSLWSVSDYTTRELMTNYYKNLKQDMGRGAALRQVQLTLMKRSGREHPFYWAAFIQSGEWANLDGKR